MYFALDKLPIYGHITFKLFVGRYFNCLLQFLPKNMALLGQYEGEKEIVKIRFQT